MGRKFARGAQIVTATPLRAAVALGVVVAVVATATVAFAAIVNHGAVTTCFNSSTKAWHPVKGTTCPAGTQKIVFYTKQKVDSLIKSVTPKHHTLTIYEDETTGTSSTGTGAGSSDVYNDFLAYDNSGLTGTPVSTDDSVYVHTSAGFAFLATLTFVFSNGSIEAMASWPDNQPSDTFAIVGGTNVFKGITGQVAFGTQVGNALPVIFDYTLPA
jgi:Dirigent-like protein